MSLLEEETITKSPRRLSDAELLDFEEVIENGKTHNGATLSAKMSNLPTVRENELLAAANWSAPLRELEEEEEEEGSEGGVASQPPPPPCSSGSALSPSVGDRMSPTATEARRPGERRRALRTAWKRKEKCTPC